VNDGAALHRAGDGVVCGRGVGGRWRGCCRWSSTPARRRVPWCGWAGGSPRRRAGSARGLALGLLGLSVAANALGHGLAAFALAPPWWVVVTVSVIAPAVLGAVVHLAVLVGRPAAAVIDAAGLAARPPLTRCRRRQSSGQGRHRAGRRFGGRPRGRGTRPAAGGGCWRTT
jgi:hypothetical protein